MTPTAELLTRVFALLERTRERIGCRCHGFCNECTRLRYDINGLLNNETQGDRP